MKKFLKLCAAFSLMGALFVGCIDNSEPDGLKALRLAKAEYIRAEQQVLAARAGYITAKAEYERAKANLINAKADILKQKAEAEKIKNDYERGILQAKIAAEVAKYNRMQEQELTRLWKERQKSATEEANYIKTLMDLKVQLAEAKMTALDKIFNDIARLVIERASLENQKIEWLARYRFWEDVELPKAQRQLEIDLEVAQLQYTHWKYLYDEIVAVKNLAISEYVDFANHIMPKITDLDKQEVSLHAQIARLEEQQADYEVKEDIARNAYFFSGVNTELTNINIPVNFSKTVSDIFSLSWLPVGESSGGFPIILTPLSGVYENNYSFYYPIWGTDHPIGAKASLGYKNALDVLKSDYNKIKEGRIYGLEGNYAVTQELNKREKAMTDAIAAYEKACKAWRDNYAVVTEGPAWEAEYAAWQTALGAYNGVYGLTDSNLYVKAFKYLFFNDQTCKPTSGTSQAAKDDATANAHVGLLLMALAETDVNQRNLYMSAVPVNCLYSVQKFIIDTYIANLKALLAGEYEGVDWSSTKVTLSDILGGITFNPQALMAKVLGDSNLAVFNAAINTIMGVLINVDLIAVLNAVMPGYYAKTASWLGASLYGAGPIFEKYHVTGNWEYHAWFLLYLLFEDNAQSIGNGIFRINANYKNTAEKLCDDFLGYHGIPYPGAYLFTTKKKSSASIVIGDRVDNVTLAFTSGARPGHPIFTTLLNAENALRGKWHAYGKALSDLNTNDKNLYNPYHRVWSVDGYSYSLWDKDTWGATPPWIADEDCEDWDYEGVPNDNFYFMPELAMDRDYPSLEDGKDIYWANLAWPFGTKEDGTTYGMDWFQINYYPAIAAKRGSLVQVNWNQWKNEGYPIYNTDPILWVNDFTKTWENNANISTLAYVPKSMVTTRNYEQYKFWSSAETQQAYKDLAAEISLKIDALQEKVDALYQAWLDAEAEVTLKQYEIWALRTQANMYRTAADYYQVIYNGLFDELHGSPSSWVDLYEAIFTDYTNAASNYEWAKANYDTFISSQAYYSSPSTFVNNMLIYYQGQLDAIDARFAIVEEELRVLELQKTAILDVLIK